MNFSWLLNGTMEAHHLAAVYLAVWIIQGGYAGWMIWQWTRAGRASRPVEPLGSTSRKHL
jgi:hypothetical protein